MKLLPQLRTDGFSGNALFIFLVRFFPSLANILVVICFSRWLDKEVYGLYQNFWIQLNVFIAIACLGFHAFIITYSPAVIAGMMRLLNRQHYLVYGLWILLVSCVFAALQDKIFGFAMPVAFCMLYAASVITESVLMGYRNFKALVSINLLYTMVFAILHWLFLIAKFDMDVLFLYLLLLTAMRFAIYLLLVSNQSVKPVPAEEIKVDEVRKLWMHLGVYDTSQILFRWIDKFIISLFLAAEVSAIYFNGSLEIPFLPLLLGAASSAALMQLAMRKDIEDETKLAVQIANHSSRILSAIVFPLFFFFLFFREELFVVLLGDKYLAAVPIFAVAILAMPLRAYSFTSILQNRHKGAIINKGALFDLVIACAMMYPLYLLLGLPGVALSFVASSYLQAGYYLYHTARVLQVPVFSLMPLGNWLIKLIVFGSLFIAFHYWLFATYSPRIVLFLGGVLAMAACAACLAAEFYAVKKTTIWQSRSGDIE